MYRLLDLIVHCFSSFFRSLLSASFSIEHTHSVCVLVLFVFSLCRMRTLIHFSLLTPTTHSNTATTRRGLAQPPNTTSTTITTSISNEPSSVHQHLSHNSFMHTNVKRAPTTPTRHSEHDDALAQVNRLLLLKRIERFLWVLGVHLCTQPVVCLMQVIWPLIRTYSSYFEVFILSSFLLCFVCSPFVWFAFCLWPACLLCVSFLSFSR